jgi:hypothetical protein
MVGTGRPLGRIRNNCPSSRRTIGARPRTLTTVWPFGSFSMKRICCGVSKWVPGVGIVEEIYRAARQSERLNEG